MEVKLLAEESIRDRLSRNYRSDINFSELVT